MGHARALRPDPRKVRANLTLAPAPLERCILCGTATTTRADIQVDRRIGYVEGAGQLCPRCLLALR